MKFTLSWLKDHLETDASLDEILDTLNMVGLEVEEVDDRAAMKPFTIAKVLEARQHPNADRLRVCIVETGEGDPVQVVCGAPNARTGMTGVFAPAGTFIPGTGIDLKPGVIRGEASNGMLCSERELQLSDDHEGIIDLPESAPLGIPFATWAGLDDPVIEIGVTPNRSDCLGIHGVARDLAAAGIGELKEKARTDIRGSFPCPVDVTLDFPDGHSLCPAFGLRLVRGVANGQSPEWMQKRLRAIGLRPINTLVDITNYMTYDRGRPLHVFDAAKVHGNLVVRRAKTGEELTALDGKTYTLDDTMCVIADEREVESLSGIMGGEASGCSETTTDVLIESALWEPLNIARTGRELGIMSDARHRFERGVDPAVMMPGLEEATRLVMDLCGGEPSESVVAGTVPDPSIILDFPVEEVKRLAGLDVKPHEAKAVLNRLGFWVSGTPPVYKVAAPSWRPDIHGKADLVEEVMRIIGIDRVPLDPLPGGAAVNKPVLTRSQRQARLARRTLAGRGMVEAITWSFVPRQHAEAFGGGAAALELANPISSDLTDMRPSLVPSLLVAGQRNADRGFGNVALFEVGPAYAGERPEDQSLHASGIRQGTERLAGGNRHWSGPAASVDAFDAKADALAVLAAIGAPVDKVAVATEAPAWYHPGRSGAIKLGPKTVLAYFGEVHPRVLRHLDVDGPVVAFEVFPASVPVPKAKATKSKPVLDSSELMPVHRDFAFMVDASVEAGAVLRAAQGADKTLIADVGLFDIYEGTGIDPGKKSLAIEVVLQPRDKTLTDEEIDAVADKVVAQVAKATGGVLRG
ncbi:MAG: phenylalanine--tRNA ligase subunit beta [Pseudomonadota bacterium]